MDAKLKADWVKALRPVTRPPTEIVATHLLIAREAVVVLGYPALFILWIVIAGSGGHG